MLERNEFYTFSFRAIYAQHLFSLSLLHSAFVILRLELKAFRKTMRKLIKNLNKIKRRTKNFLTFGNIVSL